MLVTCEEHPTIPIQRSDLIRASVISYAEKYEANKLLGEGTFGKVFLVTHRETGIRRAAKTIRKASIDNWNLFLKEIEALVDLDHPHIIKLVEYFKEESQVHLIFELCTGPDFLDKIIDAINGSSPPTGCGPGRMPTKEVAVAVRQMLRGILACHSMGIVHRDIKPENFMIKDKDKQGLHMSVKLIDLGLATRFGKDGAKLTERRGTVAYMAPEVFLGAYGPACDVWSLGVIFYLLLTGTPMFSDGHICTESYTKMRLDEIHSAVDQQALDLLKQMLCFDPAERVSAAKALQHPFIVASYDHDCPGHKLCQQCQANARHPWDTELVPKLQAFAQMRTLKRCALTIIAHLALDQDTTLQRRTFRKIDSDGDGELSQQEMEAFITKTHGELPTDWEKVFSVVDMDQRGRVNYCEFLAATLPDAVARNDKYIHSAFQVLDVTQDDGIRLDDLEGFLGQGRHPRDLLDAVIRDADINGRGYLTYFDFKSMMLEQDFDGVKDGRRLEITASCKQI